MDAHSLQQAFHDMITNLTKDVLHNKSEEKASTSYMYLDAKTINLLLLYLLMNKELQMTRLTNRNPSSTLDKELIDELDNMIVKNKKAFEELLNEMKTNL